MKITNICYVLIILSGLLSCTSQKNYIYLQDRGGDAKLKSDTNNTFTYKIKPKDVLFIKTVSIDQESSLSLSSSDQTSIYSSELSSYLNSYTVSDSGFVELPLVGKILVSDLAIEEIQKAIQAKVNYYLKNSLVIVKLLNFNVTVLGEVNQPGTFKVNNTQLSILEAIGLAGDLTINGNRKEMVLIRQNNAGKTINIDLTDKNILLSEYYYLLPNDVLYVKPNKSKFYGTNPFPFGVVLTSVTTFILVLNYLSK